MSNTTEEDESLAKSNGSGRRGRSAALLSQRSGLNPYFVFNINWLRSVLVNPLLHGRPNPVPGLQDSLPARQDHAREGLFFRIQISQASESGV